MRRLAAAAIGFAALCLVAFLSLRSTRLLDAPPVKSPEQILLEESTDLAARAERALDEANYGEARRRLTALRSRLEALRLHRFGGLEARAGGGRVRDGERRDGRRDDGPADGR